MKPVKTLLAFPNVREAFVEIDMDQWYGPYPGPKLNVPIPDSWEWKFTVTEFILAQTKDIMLTDVWYKIPHDRQREMEQDSIYDGGTDIWDVIVLPCNDHDKWLLESLDYPPQQIADFRAVLNEYFDGELGPILGPPQEHLWPQGVLP